MLQWMRGCLPLRMAHLQKCVYPRPWHNPWQFTSHGPNMFFNPEVRAFCFLCWEIIQYGITSHTTCLQRQKPIWYQVMPCFVLYICDLKVLLSISGDPELFHAKYIAHCTNVDTKLTDTDVVSMARLASNVKKSALICAVDLDSETITYQTLNYSPTS